MSFNRVLVNVEHLSDLLIAPRIRYVSQNLALPRREFGTSHRFSKFRGDTSRQQRFSCRDSANCFPDLLGSGPFDQVTFSSGLQGAANILFAFLSCHHDNSRRRDSSPHQVSTTLQSLLLPHPQTKHTT